jgi:hypothetical protein
LADYHVYSRLEAFLCGKKKELKQHIFRDVEIKEQDFDDLQAQLTAAEPQRFHIARSDVHQFKSGILGLFGECAKTRDTPIARDPGASGDTLPKFPLRYKIMVVKGHGPYQRGRHTG